MSKTLILPLHHPYHLFSTALTYRCCSNEYNLHHPVMVDEAMNFFKKLGVTDFTFDSCRLRSSEKTGLKHIVFGIAALAKLWDKRKNYYTKLWWKPDEKMREIVWLDKAVKTAKGEGNKYEKPMQEERGN
nr:uncharacterized protein LOC109148236 [Ipomoea trifida]